MDNTLAYEPPQGKFAYAWWTVTRFVRECIRVLKITKKPTQEEYKTILKVSGLGTLIIGAIGFLVYIVREIIVNV